MTSLTIKDIPVTEELDAEALAAIQGGTFKGVPDYWVAFYGAATDVKFDATQMMSQSQNVLNNNGNNVAFSTGISSTVNPSQSGQNNIKL